MVRFATSTDIVDKKNRVDVPGLGPNSQRIVGDIQALEGLGQSATPRNLQQTFDEMVSLVSSLASDFDTRAMSDRPPSLEQVDSASPEADAIVDSLQEVGIVAGQILSEFESGGEPDLIEVKRLIDEANSILQSAARKAKLDKTAREVTVGDVIRGPQGNSWVIDEDNGSTLEIRRMATRHNTRSITREQLSSGSGGFRVSPSMDKEVEKEREVFARDSTGGLIFIRDVRDSDGFKGNFWVQFAQSGNEHNAYTVSYHDDRSSAERKAREVKNVMF